MRVRSSIFALAGAVLTFAAGCGGGSAAPVRIGVLSDCYGPFGSTHELVVASAEVPLIERGARLRGRNPSAGIVGASVAGRPVELSIGCIAGTEEVLPEARRLVEEDGAQIVVGPLIPEHGLVLREYAHRRPETAFLIQPSGAPELTLHEPASNVFRFTSDNAQSVAGLGSHAYNTLGWRTAATVADDAAFGWGVVAGFVAEFCALGGRIVDRQWITVGTDPAQTVPRIPESADGVYLGPAVSSMEGFVRRYSEGQRDPSKRLLSNGVLLYEPQALARAPGLIVGGSLPAQPTPAAGDYLAAFTRAFPRIPAAAALSPLAVPYRDGVEAALQALERAEGATGKDLMSALTHLELDSLTGRIHLDRNRQAVGPNYLSQVGTDAKGKPAIKPLRVVPNVEQTFGGYFKPDDPPPSRTSPACKHGNPPPWAR